MCGDFESMFVSTACAFFVGLVCMRKYGWAILRDLTSVFAPSARFTREQQNYINKSKYPIWISFSPTWLGSWITTLIVFFLLLQVSLEDQTLELVFEGITINSKVDHFTPSYCEPTDNNPRVQLAASTSGAEYTLLYQEQLRNIIEGYQVTAGQETPIDFESTVNHR